MAEKALTTFKTLELVESGSQEFWRPSGFQDARDREHALRLFAARDNPVTEASTDLDGVFVAVSEAAWQPRTVKVTSTPKVEISAA